MNQARRQQRGRPNRRLDEDEQGHEHDQLDVRQLLAQLAHADHGRVLDSLGTIIKQ
jgi:hypothetical protein